MYNHNMNADQQAYYNQMMMQPEMLMSCYTPTYSSGGYPTPHSDYNAYPTVPSHPNSPWMASADPFHSRQQSGSWHMDAPVGEAKKYRHNPYASASEQSTPPASPLTLSATNSSMGYQPESYAALPSPAAPVPVYDPSYMDGSNHPVSNTIEDQFNNTIGSIAQTACTPRGRTLLLNVIRLQHLDKIQLIFAELCQSLGAVLQDPHGCHVLRFLVEYLQDEDIDLLMQTLNPELTYSLCTYSQHSRRVLQCLVEQHKTPRIQPLIDSICHRSQCLAIAKTQQGCIAIMRVLENVITPQKDQLFHAIAPFFAELSVDQFGNYTVQTAIQQFDRQMLSDSFIDAFDGQFVHVSCNKFGSNVMEKIVPQASNELLHLMLQVLCYNDSNLHRLMQDGYGNFVIQALVEATAGSPEGRRLCETVRPHLASSPYGHKIEAKLRSKRLLSSAHNEANIRTGYSSNSSSCDGH